MRIRALPLLALPVAALAACTNFHTVEDGRFYRSGQMTTPAFVAAIEEHGIRTLICLRAGGPGTESFEQGRRAAERTGARIVHLPLTSKRPPTRDQLLALWALFETIDYPALVHCQGGADRSGLASAVYVLQRTGDLDAAAGQLAFLPYLHTGLRGSWQLDEVFRRYRAWHGTLSFPRWLIDVYAVTDGEPASTPAEPPLCSERRTEPH